MSMTVILGLLLLFTGSILIFVAARRPNRTMSEMAVEWVLGCMLCLTGFAAFIYEWLGRLKE